MSAMAGTIGMRRVPGMHGMSATTGLPEGLVMSEMTGIPVLLRMPGMNFMN